MTLIAGLCPFDASEDRGRALSDMVLAQSAGAAWPVRTAGFDGAQFAGAGLEDGAAGSATLSPLIVPGRQLLVADARLDNRDALLSALGFPASTAVNDGELLCRCWAALGDRVLQLVRGDFALAIWNRQEGELTLARDITGQRPLHFFHHPRFVAFASMPHGLLALPEVSGKLDDRLITAFIADIPRAGDRTYFEEVRRVEPGQVVRIGRAGVAARQYWDPPRSTIRFKSDADYVEALREQLDRAVGRRLSGAGDTVGAQLSAGLDSGGVAATAARLLTPSGGRVLAFTSAPREGFAGPLPRGRIADESSLAAAVADLHPNMEHVVLRAEGVSPLTIIRRDSPLFGEPLGLPCNQVWWAAITDAAQAAGLKVLLTAEAGNLSLSSGQAIVLSEFVRAGKLLRLGRESLALHRNGLRWRGIAYAAFGPWLARPVRAGLVRLYWGKTTAREGSALLTERARDLLPRAVEAASRTGRRPSESREWRAALLQNADPGAFRKGTLLRWGIDERDPTTDRDLVEFCLSLPPEQLLKDGKTRSLARRALADRLPPDIIDGPRGYQGADWYERVDAKALLQLVNELGSELRAGDVIDGATLTALAESWPAESEGCATGSVISRYRFGLLRALSAAVFMAGFRGVAGAAALRSAGAGDKAAAICEPSRSE